MESKIQKFYESSKIFVTGGTGFLGKILVEKLLRSTDVSVIYLLVRGKGAKNAQSRLEEIFDDEMFDRLKKERPKFKNRVEVISGDCYELSLGLSLEDRQKVICNTEIIFHLAANLSLNGNFKTAYNINVNATKDLLDLAREMKRLKVFMHVSTAYSNSYDDRIEENFSDIPISAEKLEQIVKKSNRQELQSMTSSLIHPWPNTYLFTKATAEQLIKDSNLPVPVGVFRPSIIVSSYKEPLPGYLDNYYGPNGVAIGYLLGVTKVMCAGSNCIADMIPVDTCAAGLIASAWDVSCRGIEETPPIYNYVSGRENPVTWDDYVHFLIHYQKKWPYSQSMWFIMILYPSNNFVFLALRFILHNLPATLVDIFRILSGKRPRMLKSTIKKHSLFDELTKFSRRSFEFSNENTVNLWKKLEGRDRELFPMSMANVNWWKYFDNYVFGIRKFLLKDPESNVSNARKRDKRLLLLNKVTLATGIYVLCMVLSNMFSKIFDCIFNFLKI